MLKRISGQGYDVHPKLLNKKNIHQIKKNKICFTIEIKITQDNTK
jgi:hypothetical protein